MRSPIPHFAAISKKRFRVCRNFHTRGIKVLSCSKFSIYPRENVYVTKIHKNDYLRDCYSHISPYLQGASFMDAGATDGTASPTHAGFWSAFRSPSSPCCSAPLAATFATSGNSESRQFLPNWERLFLAGTETAILMCYIKHYVQKKVLGNLVCCCCLML